MTVLLTARKVHQKSTLFNFESVYLKYRQFLQTQQSSHMAAMVDLSRQTFLKIFLDLVNQGFLRSESETDILSVNNKVSLGFRAKDFDNMIDQNRNQMDVSAHILNWARGA